MAKYRIDYEFDFTPSRENAQELLLDLAALAGEWAKDGTAADHSNCIPLESHQKAVDEAKAPLLQRIRELTDTLNGPGGVKQSYERVKAYQAQTQTTLEQAQAGNRTLRDENMRLQAIIQRLQAENGQLRKATPTTATDADGKAIGQRASNFPPTDMRGMVHVGELIKLVPRPETGGQWYGGVVKKIHGKGGSGGIEVLPKGHGRTIMVRKNEIKRYAVNERADMERLASEMGVPVG